MSFRNLVFSELPLVVFATIMLMLIGSFVGQIPLFMLFGAALYLAWHLFHLYFLLTWLDEGGNGKLPAALGTWGRVYNSLDKQQRRNRKRKNRLFDILGRYRDTTEAMPDATIIVRPEGDIEWYNEVAREYFGFKPKKDRGRKIIDVVKDDAFYDLLDSKSPFETIELSSPIDKERILSIRVVPYGKGQRLVLARDVSKMHQLRMVRKDFVANVSHELRTPITVIAGFLETLGDYFADNEQVAGSIKMMQQQSDRMSCIIQDLLYLSRLEAADNVDNREDVAIPLMLETLASEAKALSGKKHHRITTKLDQSLWLKGEAKELQSAFSNLISNAIRYTPDGGEIKIHWQKNKQGHALLQVIDTGDGIAQEHIGRLTERFYRVDPGRSRDSGGTGLGLAIVKHVLNHHNGELLIESEEGQGSTFSCQFPKNILAKAK